MSKLLTIVVPTYNTEQYIERCLSTLIVPRFMEQLEVLVVIDGSPDNSAEISRRYEEKFPDTFKVINKENGGHGSTINKGIELASGKYFRVLDSDDWVDNVAFERYLDEISTIDVDMILGHSSRELVYENKSENLTYEGIEYMKVYDASTFDYTNYSADKFIVMANVTYSTAVVRRSGIKLFEKCFYVDVQYSTFVFSEVRNFVFSEQNVYKYFIGRSEQSVSAIGYRKNYLHHRNVMLSCAGYLDNKLQSLDNNNSKKWLKDNLLEKVGRHFYMSAAKLKTKEAINEIVTYKELLKSSYPAIYDELHFRYKLIKLENFNVGFAVLLLKIYTFIRR